MADFLSTGVSGLRAFQRALDVTSHNIANVGTEGYSRQRAEFGTRPPEPNGSGWVGSGVAVTTVRRIYDDLLAQQARASSSSLERFDVFAAQTERIANLFGNTETGLSATLQKFANALQEVANSPASLAGRQVLLSEAESLVERLKSYDSQLAQFDREIESRLASEVSEVNSIASHIAQLNSDIATGFARTGQPPNDLVDQRDRMLDELAGHIDVTSVPQGDGRVNVFVGSGQALVLGDGAAELRTGPDPYDDTRHGVALASPGGASIDITTSVTGGTLGGMLDFRSQILDPTRNTIGRMSVGLTEAVNAQHHEGIDLSGALGLDFFAVGGAQSLRHSANPSNATLNVIRADIGALTEADYAMQLTAGGWELRRADTGAAVAFTGTGTVADPFVAEGLEIVVSGTAQVGDRFLVRPTRSAVAGLEVLISDPARVAAAAPIRSAADIDNTGTGEISAGEVLDASDPQLRATIDIEFLTATTYSVNGAGSFSYTSGDPIDLNGWRITISGAPAVGDRFTVSDNAGGTGDNRNALAMVDALKQPLLDGGTISLDVTASRLTGTIGVATRQAQASRDAQSVLHKSDIDARDSVSGVNLDEEAANMLRYQQAYQAAAQMIRVASTLFDTLLGAAR